MKRFIGILILLCALVIHVLPFSVVSASKWNFEEEMGKADTFLKNAYGYEDYYSQPCKYGSIIKEYITDGHGAFYGYPLILFGSPKASTDSYFKEKASSSPAGSYSKLNLDGIIPLPILNPRIISGCKGIKKATAILQRAGSKENQNLKKNFDFTINLC